jgi:hypothetical protein
MKILVKLLVLAMLAAVSGNVWAQTTVWNGTRWSRGVPNAGTHVVIDTGTVYSAAHFGGFACRSLLLEPKAQLNVLGGQSVNVSFDITLSDSSFLYIGERSTVHSIKGSINNHGTVELDGGSIIQSAERGGFLGGGNSLIRQRSRTEDSIPQVWSSPVQNFSLANFSFREDWMPVVLDENSRTWVSLAGQAVPGVGYVAWAPGRVTFSGVFNAGDIEVPVQDLLQYRYSSGLTTLGNPYPSAIDVLAFMEDNKWLIDGNVWVWDAEQQRYLVLNYLNIKTIALAQGFFVRVREDAYYDKANKIVFRNTQRTNEPAKFYRRESSDGQVLRLSLGQGRSLDELVVAFDQPFGLGHDAGYDGEKLDLPLQRVALSAVHGGSAYGTLALPAQLLGQPGFALPLTVRVREAGWCQLAGTAETDGANWQVLDRQTGKVYPVGQGQAHAVYLGAGTHQNRFFLRQGQPVSVAGESAGGARVYAHGRDLYVLPTAAGLEAQVSVVSLTGQEVQYFGQVAAQASATRLPVQVPASGLYLVRTVQGPHVQTTRVWLER